MRKITSFADVQIVLNDLQNERDYVDNHNRNTNMFQIKNTGIATDPDDVVVLKQLHDYYDKRKSVIEKAGGGGGVATLNWTARAILPGIQSVANDVLANRYIVNLAAAASKVTLAYATITAKVKPSANSYIADFLRSSDNALTWTSILPAAKLVLPVGSEYIKIVPSWAIRLLAAGDQIRVDVLQTDVITSGIELALFGQVE